MGAVAPLLLPRLAQVRQLEAEAELEEVKEKLAVVEVELQVLREGGGASSGFGLCWSQQFIVIRR